MDELLLDFPEYSATDPDDSLLTAQSETAELFHVADAYPEEDYTDDGLTEDLFRRLMDSRVSLTELFEGYNPESFEEDSSLSDEEPESDSFPSEEAETTETPESDIAFTSKEPLEAREPVENFRVAAEDDEIEEPDERYLRRLAKKARKIQTAVPRARRVLNRKGTTSEEAVEGTSIAEDTAPYRPVSRSEVELTESAPTETESAFTEDDYDSYGENEESAGKHRKHTNQLLDRIKEPLLHASATRNAIRKNRQQEASAWPTPIDIRETPELSPIKASKYYAAQARPMRLRIILALIQTLILCWICFRLPMAGQLGENVVLQALVSLVLLLSVMVCTLDTVTSGLQQLLNLSFEPESLLFISCVFSIIDCGFSMAGAQTGLPYCAANAVLLLAASLAQMLYCQAESINFRTAAMAAGGSILTAAEDKTAEQTLMIQRRAENNPIVRRSEKNDCTRNTYATAAPILMIFSFILALLSALWCGWLSLIHNLSAFLCLSCSLWVFLSYPLSYLLTILRLNSCGIALAGWEGCRDIGKSAGVLITDQDLFPGNTIQLTGSNILEGADREKVVTYTVSLLEELGCATAGAFAPLMAHKKFHCHPVEEFACHDGGGISGYLYSEQTLVGSYGFMKLKGISVPADLNLPNAVYTAISNELVGVFELKYIPVKGVRYALALLEQGRAQPVFAVRDFNITLLMIQQIFRLQTLSFDFPSFRERCRLSRQLSDENAQAAALLSRPGLRGSAEASEYARRLYRAGVINSILCPLCSAIGMILAFFLLRGQSAAVLSCGRLLAYLLVWLLPGFAVCYGIYR